MGHFMLALALRPLLGYVGGVFAARGVGGMGQGVGVLGLKYYSS